MAGMMFSYVQNIGSASESLKAKAVDSRLGDKNKHSQKNQNNEKSGPLIYEGDVSLENLENLENREDTNHFSIDSLIYFLEDFLELHLNTFPAEDGRFHEPYISSLPPWLRSKHSNLNVSRPLAEDVLETKASQNKVAARYAVHAYTHRSLSANVRPAPLDRHKTIKAEEQNENVTIVYDLIDDLRILKLAGVTHLNVGDSMTFLEGIDAAIKNINIYNQL